MQGVIWLLWVGLLASLGVCQQLYVRFWWQDLVSATAPLWAPVVVLGLVLAVRSWRRAWRPDASWYRRLRRHVILAIVLVAHAAPLFWLGETVRPYIFFRRWPAVAPASLSVSLLFVPVSLQEDTAAQPQSGGGDGALQRLYPGPEAVSAALSAYQPDLVALVGAPPTYAAATGALTQYPVSVQSAVHEGWGVQLFSRVPVYEPPVRELGVDALPGLYVAYKLANGALFEVGVLRFVAGLGQRSFELNQVTSRRIATRVRNSARPRLVLGSFSASSYSQLVTMFVRQGRLRSVFFGRGVQQLWELPSPLLRGNHGNIFVSRQIAVEQVQPLWEGPQAQAGLLVRVRIPELATPLAPLVDQRGGAVQAEVGETRVVQ